MKEEIIERLLEDIKSQCKEIDADEAYDEMLNDCYSLETVGGPFSHMQASRVLSEVDPIGYRCGFSDFTDSQEWIEIGDSYYDRRDVEQAKEEYVNQIDSTRDEIESECEEAQTEITDLEDGMDDCETMDALALLKDKIAVCEEKLAELEAKLETKQTELDILTKHRF